MNEENQEDLEKQFEDNGLINPVAPCEICGARTRNIYHCTPICEDCEELIRKGK